jgi:acetylglutamate kinase
VNGQRVTSPEAMEQVEMALKGKVNGRIVGYLNYLGVPSVGLSGKDGGIVTAVKKTLSSDSKEDLGRVGNVASVNTDLLRLLIVNRYLPVLTCVAADINGEDYNINGDNFAGAIAGALQVNAYIILTDVDGLYTDKNDPSSRLDRLRVSDVQAMMDNGMIQGGMIPKLDSCIHALKGGSSKAIIMNGTKPELIFDIFKGKNPGTIIELD